MPTIQTTQREIEGLLGRKVDPDSLIRDLLWAKGELKSWGEAEDDDREIKIELNDTNRPDTWTPEGIARQLRGCAGEGYPAYDFLESDPVGTVEVSPEMETIRPYVGAFLARGPAIDDGMLRSLIQTQEKLSDTFGRRRRDIAAGIYKLDLVQLPVRYGSMAPDAEGFVPLGETKPMTPAEILRDHTKGREYAGCLEGFEVYPVLRGADDRILSMPPIINSADVGAIEVGDSDLFVEFTGASIEVLNVAIAIMAADMADRGFRIERVATKYPYDTPWGREVAFPHDPGSQVDVPLARIQRSLGISLPEDEVIELLERFGLGVERKECGVLGVRAPFYRNDLLHVMDVIEDVAICRGYDSFPHHPPTSYTVGRLTPVENFSQRVRQRLVGFGFQELTTPVLTHRDNLTEKMACGATDLVEILNPMSENFGVIRNRLLPTLLECEQRSYRASYPHRIFECGEVARQAPGTVLGTETVRAAAALVAHAEAGFAEVHSVLDSLLAGLGFGYRLEACEVAGYLEGRAGAVMVGDVEVGTIGEVHPEVLDRWGIKVPCGAIELEISRLIDLL